MIKNALKEALLTLLALLCGPILTAQETESFALPNGLQIRTRHLANTGIVSARLVLSWTEGDEKAPAGTAWIMSMVLPALGSGGMDRDEFQSRKDQAGVLSQITVGNGWIAWTFDAVPANADMMIQLLADEALRPAWAASERLPELLAKAWEGRQFKDERSEAVHAFKTAVKDPDVPNLPDAPIDAERFYALWSNVRRPEIAALCIVGDIESLSLRRIIFQHFGPWEGVRANKTEAEQTKTAKTTNASKPEWLKRLVNRNEDCPEIWVGWNLDNLSPDEIAPFTALIPWLLREALPASDEVISAWEADPGGRWFRAAARPGVSLEKLESRLKAMLNLSITQEMLDSAIAARDEHARFNTLRPRRALEQGVSFTPSELSEIIPFLTQFTTSPFF